MTDVASFAAGLSALRTAGEILQGIRQAGSSVTVASLKLQLADLSSALANVKNDFTDARELVARQQTDIARLKEALELRGAIKRSGDAYYRVASDGKCVGRPYCLRCWDVDHKQRQLVNDAGNHFNFMCTDCDTRYSRRSVAIFEEAPPPPPVSPEEQAILIVFARQGRVIPDGDLEAQSGLNLTRFGIAVDALEKNGFLKQTLFAGPVKTLPAHEIVSPGMQWLVEQKLDGATTGE